MTRDAIQTTTATEPGESRSLPFDAGGLTYDSPTVTYAGAVVDRRSQSTDKTLRSRQS